MYEKQDPEREIIEEQDVIDNLVDENDPFKQEFGKVNSHNVVYTKRSGCFDIKSMIINLFIYTLVLMVTSGIFRGFYIESFMAAIHTSVIMSILNIILKPILVFITLPLTIMTFGVFYIFINGILLLVASWIMGPAFVIISFSTAVFASIFISILRMAINHYILKDDRLKVN